MNSWLLIAASFLLLNLAAGSVRILRGPSQADRMMAAQLFGTTGVAVLLLLIPVFGIVPLIDVALIYALLAIVAALAFIKRFWQQPDGKQGDSHESQ
jgi:multicomponent Na+:H+ antiporter subunit F